MDTSWTQWQGVPGWYAGHGVQHVASPRVAQARRVAEAATVAEEPMLAEVASPMLVASNGQQEAQSNPCGEASNHVHSQWCEQ